MKKVLFFGIALIIIVSTYGIISNYNQKYTSVIKKEWSIDLPNSYEELYSIESETSLNGDSQRFHVFSYEIESDLSKTLNWKTIRDTKLESEMNRILEKLSVVEEYTINFEYKYSYFTKVKADFSKIYLVYIEESKLLYVVEDNY